MYKYKTVKMNNFYVYKRGELVGEAVKLTKTTYIHYYNSRNSHQYDTDKLPKNLKLVAK